MNRIISIFEDLTDAELARIAQSCVTRAYERHAQIYEEHDLANDVFFILALSSVGGQRVCVIEGESSPDECHHTRQQPQKSVSPEHIAKFSLL
jgi:signal-transduction protein with cAMP-binding, CBS, and nucleotidyltransferase domain